MNLIDIISLAKAGYKKSDIDELLQTPVDEPEQVDDSSPSTDDKPLSEGDKEKYPEENVDDKPDYETLYNTLKTETNTLKTELENVKKQLEDAQKKNIKTNNDTNVNNSEEINDIFRSFM